MILVHILDAIIFMYLKVNSIWNYKKEAYFEKLQKRDDEAKKIAQSELDLSAESL